MSEQPHENPPDDPRLGMSDERIDRVIGNLLRAGVIASALVVLAGGIVMLARHGREIAPDRSVFHEERPEFRSLRGITGAPAELRGQAVIMLGLLVLIATPVARVVYSVFAFALQRDYLYVLVTLIVLTVLLYSLYSGYLS
jgi:uncharacterized membrane protein